MPKNLQLGQTINWQKATLVGAAGLVLGVTGLVSPGEAIALPPTSPANQKATIENTKITEPEIRAILDQMLAASRNRDAEGVLKFMAASATIDLTVQTRAGSNKLRLTRQQYADYLKQGMAAIEQYQAQYSSIRVRVAADGKSAVATYILEETSVLKNQPIAIAAVSNEVVSFQRVQGQLQATGLRAIARVEIKQIERR